jgi:actin-related protein
VFIYFSFVLGITPICSASIPSNGVLQTSRSLDSILSVNDAQSAYNQCVTQNRGARYFSNSCTKLIDTLRKKMNMMVLESDLQMQAEKIAKKPLPKDASSRIAMLAKINLLSTQAEETIKTAQTASKNNDSKEDLPDIVTSIQKVQTSVAAYTQLFPNGIR